MDSGIYIIENKINGHRYVGSSINLEKRFRDHRNRLCNKIHDNAYLQNAWNKYGEAEFEFEILELWEPEFLVSMEQWWMNMLCPEHNICPVAGSRLGSKATDETKAKIGAAHKGKTTSDETKAKMSAAQKGKKHTDEAKAKMSAAHKGKKLSDEHKAKMSKSMMGNQRTLGYKHTDEARAKISAAGIGREFTDEAKARIGAASKGRNKGRKHTAEARANMSAAQKGRESSLKGKPWSPARRAAQEARCSS